jgi:hypothetical protein
MPILKFQCTSCGFSQRKRVSRGTDTIDCTSCGASAFAEGSPNLTVGFQASVSTSMRVQDSGIESFDMDYDRVIGEDAQKKWDLIYKRNRDKWDIVNSNPGSTGLDIMKLPDGTYESLPDPAKVYRETRQDRMNKLEQQRSSSSKE